jgi:hypothetical protein|tara:strand:- start:1530 stop:1679 length:150 start_codon:yes stop_codon:yes gene_type:complete
MGIITTEETVIIETRVERMAIMGPGLLRIRIISLLLKTINRLHKTLKVV